MILPPLLILVIKIPWVYIKVLRAVSAHSQTVELSIVSHKVGGAVEAG